jgi:hypothetical protein
MARKRKGATPSGPKPNDSWIYLTEMQINGRNVVKGTELKISGERGRFRFVQHVTNHDGIQWIDVWGGPKGADCMRSFYVDRVKRVHYKNQTVANLAIEHKEKLAAKKAELELDND